MLLMWIFCNLYIVRGILKDEVCDSIEYVTYDAFWPHLNHMLGSFDRIHIGSAITHKEKPHFLELLAMDGILVSPIEDGLFQIKRTEEGFKETVISQVRYRSMITPKKLPHWDPLNHKSYPPSVRSQIFTVLCIWELQRNPISMLPKEILFKIFQLIYFEEGEEDDDEDEESSY